MKSRIFTLKNLFTLFGMLYFCGFIGFVIRLLGGGVDDVQSSDLEGSFVNQLFGVCVTIICIGLAIRNQIFFTNRFWILNWTVLFFLMCVFASVMWSISPDITLRRNFALFATIAFSFYLSQVYSAESLFRLIGLTFGMAAFLGLILALVAPSYAFIAGGIREGAFIGIFSDKNNGARAYALSVILLIPYCFKRDRLALVSVICCLFCLAVAKSASGIMLLLIGGGTYFYFNFITSKHSSRLSSIKISIGIGAYVVIALLLVTGYQIVLELAGRDPTLTDRTVIWELIIPMVFDKLLIGYGYGAFWAGWGADDFIERWGYIGNAHNGYIEILLHGGVLLLSVFFLQAVVVVSKLLYRIVRAENKEYAIVSLAAVIQILVANFFAYVLPNYRAYDFFILQLIVFSVLNYKAVRRSND